MPDCCQNQPVKPQSFELTIAIAGNPNCGKSALFNQLTGIRQKTGNWPGVTVDRKEGYFELDQYRIRLIDLPGIYSLDATSVDEIISRDYLLSREADAIINVVDASNLERNLYFSIQLLEMGVPVILALNMMDVARKRGIEIDIERLKQELGCPVVPIVAVTGEGLTELKAQMLAVAKGQRSGGFRLAHEEVVEQAIADIEPLINDPHAANRRWLALKMLEADEHIQQPELKDRIVHWRQVILDRSGEEADIHIANSRFSHAHAIAQNVVKQQGQQTKNLSDRIDAIVLNRWLGIPLFLAVMYLMFLFTINIGGAFVDFFDGLAGALFIEGPKSLLQAWQAPPWLIVVLTDGIGGGLQVVATFIPIITGLYLFLSALEDSGYMARAAFVMDRFMRTIGLPGKAFVPLIVGFGCNVPAVMATRTLDNIRERKLTILMNPFMSCGARLPVYVLFAAAFFPHNGQNIVFALYLIGIAVAILSGLIMKKTLLPGQSSGFMMELPPYHLPTLKGMVLRTWDRVRLFITGAGKVIIIMVLVLNLLNSIGTDGSFGNEDSEHSVLSQISQKAVPLFYPMGIQEDNWPAVVGLLSGMLAKEVVVGTLDTLYTRIAQEAQPQPEQVFDFWAAIEEAAATVPQNLSQVWQQLSDPLGIRAAAVADLEQLAAEQEVHLDVFGTMQNYFDGQRGAFAYLLFVLLYIPCVATLGAIKKEAGGAWASFVAFWSLSIAYITASGYYQIAIWAQQPWQSSLWLAGFAFYFIAIILFLKRWAQKTMI